MIRSNELEEPTATFSRPAQHGESSRRMVRHEPQRGYTGAAVVPQVALDGVFIALGYLAGSLPMGVIVARLTGARDPRTVGSGRTGGTNAFRAMGAARGLAVGLLDVGKGAVPAHVDRRSTRL